MTRTRAEWWEKANAYAAGWAARIGSPCSARNAALGLAVAEHETQCGDAWPGTHNWGATTRRGLTDAERAALQAAGVHPVLTPTAAREASEAAAVAALVAAHLAPGEDVTLHVDSAPRSGPYFTWFAAFATDVEGANYFVHILAEQRVSCCAILNRGGNGGELAGAMYRSRYYTGNYDAHTLYDPKTKKAVEAGTPGAVPGDELDIADYSRAIAGHFPTILLALDGWTPGAEPPVYTEPAVPDLATTLGVQQALNRVCKDCAPLTEDGIDGPKTKAAIATWQRAHGLEVDGVAGAATVRSLTEALDAD